MSNAPSTGRFTGVDALARFPDAKVFVVDDVARDDAMRLFPDYVCLGVTGVPKPFDALKDRTVYLWCEWAPKIAPSILEVTHEVGIVNGNRHLLSFGTQAAQAIAYVRSNVGRYAEKPSEVEMPSASAQAVVEQPKKKAEGRKPANFPKLTSWDDLGLIRSDGGKGAPVNTLDNCVRAIERHSDLVQQFWYDSFLQKVLHTWGKDVPAEWTDYDDVRLALYLQRDVGIPKVNKGMAHDALVAYAMRERRNCAYDWLDGLEWDQESRLDNLATLGFGAEQNDYNCTVCANLLLGMVKRVFAPGCKVDNMPVFEGEQGAGKSQALGILGGAWFAELHMDWSGKDFYQALQGKMLLEIGELHAFKQADVDRIKGMVSCQSDRYRDSYGRNSEDHPRQGVFAGTTNRDDWNRDETGARRFWPILCGLIDHAWLRTHRDQLFAEAVSRIRTGSPWWVVPIEQAKTEQEARMWMDEWMPIFDNWLAGKNKVRIVDLLEGSLEITPDKQDLTMQQRAGRILRRLGWVKKQFRHGRIVVKEWVFPKIQGDMYP